jgi:hypothetical protein
MFPLSQGNLAFCSLCLQLIRWSPLTIMEGNLLYSKCISLTFKLMLNLSKKNPTFIDTSWWVFGTMTLSNWQIKWSFWELESGLTCYRIFRQMPEHHSEWYVLTKEQGPECFHWPCPAAGPPLRWGTSCFVLVTASSMTMQYGLQGWGLMS